MRQKTIKEFELEKLYKRIAELEQLEEKHKLTEEKLNAANQQLEVSFQQLKVINIIVIRVKNSINVR